MADIFISYAHEDLSHAESLSKFLNANGFSVWWDRELTAGDRFSSVIQNAISQAQVVIVLWSKNSTNSNWVNAEASEALQRGILVPLSLDDAVPPLEFKNIHTLSFAAWISDPNHPSGAALIRAISKHKNTTSAEPVTPENPLDVILSQLGLQLLSAKTAFELRSGLYEVEKFLASNPFNTQARLLQESYKTALAREESVARAPVTARATRTTSFHRYATAASLLLTIAITSVVGFHVFNRTSRDFASLPSSTDSSPVVGMKPALRENDQPDSATINEESQLDKSKVTELIAAATRYREKGNYRAALNSLKTAQQADPHNSTLRREIEQTKKACLAEQRLGGVNLQCDIDVTAEPPDKR